MNTGLIDIYVEVSLMFTKCKQTEIRWRYKNKMAAMPIGPIGPILPRDMPPFAIQKVQIHPKVTLLTWNTVEAPPFPARTVPDSYAPPLPLC